MIRIVKKGAIGLSAIALSVFGLSSTSSVFAGTSVGEGILPVNTAATADAETLAACAWYVSGIDTGVSLANSSGMEYIGDDYELTGENSTPISIFFSGSDTADTRCSFYDDEKGVSVEVSWSGTAFTATGDDASLDFEAGDALESVDSNDGDPSTFNITYTKVSDECNDDWTAGTSVKIEDGSTPPLIPASIADSSILNNYNPTNTTGATFASCQLDATYSTWIPGGITPNNPGGSYNFTGPILTTEVTINS